MMDIQYIAEKMGDIEANLKQVAETLSTMGEASARGLKHAARALESVVEELERNQSAGDRH